MKNKMIQPQFFVLYKNFNTGEIVPYDVLGVVFDEIFLPSGRINKKRFCIYDKNCRRIDIKTKEQFSEFLRRTFMYYFWSKCEWEFVCIDWPYRGDSIEGSRPVKIDVWDQLEPNLPVITDLVWNYVEPKIKK